MFLCFGWAGVCSALSRLRCQLKLRFLWQVYITCSPHFILRIEQKTKNSIVSTTLNLGYQRISILGGIRPYIQVLWRYSNNNTALYYSIFSQHSVVPKLHLFGWHITIRQSTQYLRDLISNYAFCNSDFQSIFVDIYTQIFMNNVW